MLKIKPILKWYYTPVNCTYIYIFCSKFSTGLIPGLSVSAEKVTSTISDGVANLLKANVNPILSSKSNCNNCESYSNSVTTNNLNASDSNSIAKLYKNKDWKTWWSAKSYGKHPGVCRLPSVSLPNQLILAADYFLKDFEKDGILAVSLKLNNILISRKVFKNPHSWFQKQNKDNVLLKDDNVVQLARMQSQMYSVKAKERKHTKLEEKQSVYVWKSIQYDKINAAAFLLGRSPACYASSLHVMHEIKKNLPDFFPSSMLDFGSGTGMCVWAANNLWKNSLKQYCCVDQSIAMNKMAFYLFSGGNYNKTLPGLFIRKSLPVSNNDQYDIVVSGYSLSELPSEKERITMIKHLWNRTGRFLILIEHGNFFGYFIMMEARNLLLNGFEGADKQSARKWSEFDKPANVFSPCPHSFDCPKWDTKSACFFSQKYFTPSYYHKLHPKANLSSSEPFSYVVFEKTVNAVVSEPTWPRVVDNPHNQRNCATCHLCTPMGTIEHVSITKANYGKDLFNIAKKSICGDSIPFTPLKSKT